MGTSGRQAGRQAGHSGARLFAAAVPSRRQSQLTSVFETFSLGDAVQERKQRAPAAEDCKKGQAPRLFDRAVAAAVGKRSGSEEPLRGSKRSRS